MKFIPHDYQKFCIDYIKAHPISALFLDMGLGKTVITLTAIRDLMLDDLLVSKTLVIGPLRVARDTWPAEVEKWEHLADLEVSVIVGDVKARTAALNHNALVYVINRENVKWLVEYYEKNGLRWDFDCVVIDELSSFKNHQAQRFKWLRKVRPFVKRWIGLTGTPTSNGLMDLWAEIGILDGGERLGRFIGRFRECYFKAGSMNPATGVVFSYAPRPGAEEQIYQRISDITISMKAMDYLKMPECIFVNHEVEMSATERKLYDQLKSDLIIPLEDGDIDAANAASLSNKLLQMANGAVYDENKEVRVIHQHKLEALEDLIEAANGQPVLIAYWFKHDRKRIIEHLESIGYKFGKTLRDIKDSEDIKLWNAGQLPVALIHPASAGHGLNIQSGGHILIWYGLTWSLELYQQTKGACPGISQISETLAPYRGDIWFADLGNHTGTSVQGGCRPVLVISNDTANIHAETVNVVPLTRHLKKPGLPCHMILDSGDVVDSKQSLDDSMLLAEQITTIGKPQLRSYVGRVENKEVLAQISHTVITQLSL